MFLGGNFKFNGRQSQDMYNAIICYTGSYDGRDVGLSQSINKEVSGINGMFNYMGTNRENITIPIEIVFDKKLSQKERREVINWLFVLDDQYKELEVEDNNILYYIKFKNAKWTEYPNVDLIKAEIETDSAYGYSPLIIYNNLSDETTTTNLEIDNLCNAFEFYSPNVEINFLEDGELNIYNASLGEIMTIKGVKDEIVKINCTREVVNSSVKVFKYSDVTNYLRLKFGRNVLRFSNANTEIKIICKYPMLFE